jgi:protein-disulfide isomerase-like protein with CxxC motif
MTRLDIKLDPYITDVLLRDLVGHDRRPASFLVYIWFTAEQQKFAQQGRASTVTISYQDLAESIGISKSSAQSAIAWLIRRKLLTSAKTTVTATPEYKVLTPWRSRAART